MILIIIDMFVLSGSEPGQHKHIEVCKFQALKRYGTQISLNMTLEIRSQFKGHSRYGLEIFREGVKLFIG